MTRATISEERRRFVWILAARLALLLWAVALWLFLRPPAIVGDWQGWRQADTQNIARRFTEPGGALLYPRIAWDSGGPGYVETELQLYTWLVSKCFSAQRVPEWPGQALSLAFASLAAWVIFINFARRFSALIGLLGMAAFLSTRGVVHAATSVQPEALCLVCYVLAWFSFERYLSDRRVRDLVVFATFGALAMLVKPTAAHIGISSFLLAAFGRSCSLFDAKLWLAWASMFGVLALHLLHARNLYLLTGNTFGVLSGGDSKIPDLEHLFQLKLLLHAASIAVIWGTGIAGAIALLLLALGRQFSRELAALLVGNVFWLLFTLRYSSQSVGTHYSVLAALLGALAIAELSRYATRWGARSLVLVGVGPALTLASSCWNRRQDRFPAWYDAPTLAAGRLLSHVAEPGDLVVVRSVEPSTDPFWHVHNNFEDPRVFYMSATHGFPLAKDDASTEVLEHASAAGARYYIDPLPRESSDDAVSLWLARHAEQVDTTSFGGRLFRLTPR